MDKLKEGEIDLATAQSKQAKVKKLSNRLDKNAHKLEDQLMKKMKGRSAAEKKAMQNKISGLKDQGKMATDEMSKFTNLAAKGETRSVKFLSNFSKGAKGMGWGKTAKATGMMAKGMRGAAVAGKGLGGVIKMLVKFVPHLTKLFGLSNPVGWIITAIMLMYDLIKFVMQINSEVVSISKNLGISKGEARAFRQHLFDAAYASSNILNTQQELLKVHGQINDAWGTTITYMGAAFLDDVATLQNRLGFSAEAAMNLGSNMMMSNRRAGDMVDLIGEGGVSMANNLGVALDQWKIMENTAKTTGQLRALYQGNEGALGRVHARAQSLGMTMADIHKMSQGMLNFHSSTEKEMKAELFLGKKLNLETARLAALTGDMETFHKEIMKNAGDYLDFTRMSVLQQKALADALNMSTDQLADMLFKESKLESLRGKANAQEWEKIEAQKKQMDLQQSFNAAIEQMKMILVDLLDGIEEWAMPKWMSYALGVEGGKVFATDMGEKNPVKKGTDSLVGSGLIGDDSLQLNDFSLHAHPEDTFLMAGGTGAWKGNMQQNQKQPVIVDAHLSYDAYAAVKASQHHNNKWNRKM